MKKIVILYLLVFLTAFFISFRLQSSRLSFNPKAEPWEGVVLSPTPLVIISPYPRMGIARIVKDFPGIYSDLIKKYQLIPKTLTLYNEPNDRISEGIDYLRRVQKMLEEKNSLLPPLSAYKIKDEYNFLLAIPDKKATDGGQLKLPVIISSFLDEYDKKQTRIYYDPEDTVNLAVTIPEYELTYDNNTVKRTRKSKIIFGSYLMKNNFIHYEMTGNLYVSTTDVELAGIMIHEYIHALQSQAILDKIEATALGQDSFAQLGLEKEAEKAINGNMKMEDFYSIAVPTWNKYLSDLAGFTDKIKLNEAQANAVQYFFVYTLSILNDNKGYFPGARLFDPSEKEIGIIKADNPGIRYLNLYHHFLDTIIKTGSSLTPDWLKEFPY